MFSIRPSSIPQGALLETYLRNGGYADCYVTEISGSVSQEQFVAAFYTTALFKLERLILRWAISRPSTDAQAQQLADGTLDQFAAWQVEQRGDNQLLLCDLYGRTRSWLMVTPVAGHGAVTRLYFGSAVVPSKRSAAGRPAMGGGFNLLLGFHKLYSQLLLRAARARLAAQRS